MKTPNLSDKRILIILPHRKFQDEEYQKSVSVFNRSNAVIIVASSSYKPAIGMLGLRVTPDLLIQDADAKDFDGFGSCEYWHDSDVHMLLNEAYKDNKLICAICLAPVTLANAGLLKGKKATAYNSAKSYLTCKGVKYTGKSVETSGNMITARDAETAKKFAEAIAGQLAKHNRGLNI